MVTHEVTLRGGFLAISSQTERKSGFSGKMHPDRYELGIALVKER